MSRLICGIILCSVLAGCAGSSKAPRLHDASDGHTLIGLTMGEVSDICKAIKPAKQVIVYSLDPDTHPGGADPDFHGERVVGSATIEKSAVRKQLSACLRRELGDDELNGVMCWNPYHGLRIVTEDATFDLVISDDCGHVNVYWNDQTLTRLSIASHKTGSYLNSILAAENVPVLPGATPK